MRIEYSSNNSGGHLVAVGRGLARSGGGGHAQRGTVKGYTEVASNVFHRATVRVRVEVRAA